MVALNVVNMTKQEIITACNQLEEDFQMLEDGRWIPDTDSIEASLDNVNKIRNYVCR